MKNDLDALPVDRKTGSQFIESLVRPHILDKDLEAAYRQMAQEQRREIEALEWIEGAPATYYR